MRKASHPFKKMPCGWSTVHGSHTALSRNAYSAFETLLSKPPSALPTPQTDGSTKGATSQPSSLIWQSYQMPNTKMPSRSLASWLKNGTKFSMNIGWGV